MKVLIAEDDPSSRLLLSAAVERLGHDCIAAEDGDVAAALYTEQHPGVVITDLSMPGLDGSELVSRIRSAPDAPYAYVLVLTAQADEAQARAAMEAGADDLVIKPLDPAELERKLIAAQRVTGLHRRMHADARQDTLTGVGNRLRLAEDLDALCGRVSRYGHAYCVALLDVDRFKALNDSAGHRAGDDVLGQVAGALAKTIRRGDTLYRYGGEEFLVLLPEQTLDGAKLAGERLRSCVEELALEHPTGGTVTASVGVAGLGNAGCSPDELFELADRALYRAKEGGRNRVEVEVAGEPDRDDRAVRLLIASAGDATGALNAALAGADGVQVVGTSDGADQAVAMTGMRRPDVVLLDFDMPASGGYRAATSIREAQPDVRIIAVSADESPGAQLDMTRAGAVGHLARGAAGEEIARTVRSAFRF
jgi:two-component system chemotaxis response regulator CheY